MSNGNSSEDDEQLARDMQLAMDLQAREEQKAECRRRKEEEKARRSHHSTLEDGFARDKLNADHMLFVKCCVDGGREVDLLVRKV